MLCCEKAIINCDNYGGAITSEERDDSRKEKKIKEFMMKFPIRVCETEKPMSGKDPVNQESQAFLSQVSGIGSCSCMAMKDSKPACFTNCLT